MPITYFYSNTIPVGNKFVYFMNWYNSVVGNEFIEMLDKDKPKVVLAPENLKKDNLFYDFLLDNYVKLKHFDKNTLYIRNK